MTAVVAVRLPHAPLTILTNALTHAFVGVAYSQPLTASGGSGSYLWDLDSANPNNHVCWRVVGGNIVGTPQHDNQAQYALPDTLVVRCTDALNPLNSTTATLTLATVNTGSTPVIQTAATLPAAPLNGAYFLQLTAAGGSAPYVNWKITSKSGTNSASMTLSPLGWFQYLPTTAATDTFTATCTDCTNVVSAAVTFSVTSSASIQLAGIDRLNGLINMPPARAGEKYYHKLNVPDGGSGSGPYTWAIPTGQLPTGLSLNSSTGEVTGTPTSSGNTSFTIQVTDGGSNTTPALPGYLNVTGAVLGVRPPGSTGNGFFVGNDGFFYGNDSKRFVPIGLNRVHYNNTFTGFQTSGCNTVRWSPFTTQFRGSNPSGSDTATNLFADAYSNHTANKEFVIATIFYVPGTASTQTTSDLTATDAGIIAAWWCDSFSAWVSSGLAGKAGINIANEFGPQSQNWQFWYQATRDSSNTSIWQFPVTINTTTGVITLSSNSSFHPFINAAALGYVYIAGGGIDKAVAISTTTGGSRGAWTLTATTLSDVSGWNSGSTTISGGMIGMLRAKGYTDPLFIDSGQFGESLNNLVQYGATVGASDPQQNVVLTIHPYLANNYVALISNITAGANAVVTLHSSAADHPFAPTFAGGGGTTNSGFGAYFIAGVQGATAANGVQKASANVGGNSGAWTITLTNTASLGTYTGGGIIVGDVNVAAGFRWHPDRVIAALQALQAPGVHVISSEFGPATSAGPTPTNTPYQAQVQPCYSAGLGWIPWALDGDSPFNMTTTNGSAAYTSPNQLSAYGLDAILNPRYGIHAMARPASCFL